MRSAVRLALCACVAVAASCAGAGDFKLQKAVDSLIGDIDNLLGSSSTPGKHLTAIKEVHESKSWRFRPDADDALETTRRAVRSLASCDYASWGEAAFVIEILSEMGDQHASSLVRAEALDSLRQMGGWTLKADVKPERSSTYAEMIEAIKVLKQALGQTDADAAFTFQVATAVSSLANHQFERVEPSGPERHEGDASIAALSTQLPAARGALKVVGGRALEGFQGDAGVRDALDRAYVSLSAAVIRLTLKKAVVSDPTDTTRMTAVRNLGALAPAGGGAVLRSALLTDPVASVRREAAAAFASYPAVVAVPALIDGLADEMADVRAASASSLEAVTGQALGDDRGAWNKWWRTSGAKPESTGALK